MEKDPIIIDEETLNASRESNKEETPIKAKEKKKKKMSKIAHISIDKTYEDVIQYQHEGYSLFFEDTDGRFLELTPGQQKELNTFNKEKYRIAEAISKKKLDLSSIKTAHMKFAPKASHASATNRLRVENQRPDRHYAWKRQDELQQVIYDGGRVCIDPSIKTFGAFDESGDQLQNKDSTHYVEADGIIELVLTETPVENYKAQRDALDEKSVQRNKAVDATAKAEIDALGGDSDAAERRIMSK